MQHSLIHALGWTLLHSLWQAAAISLLAFVIIYFSKKKSANFRYSILLISLVGLFGWNVATFIRNFDFLAENYIYLIDDSHFVLMNNEINQISNFSEVKTYFYSQLMINTEYYFPYLLSIWAFGILILSFRFSFGIFQIYQIKYTQSAQIEGLLQEKLIHLIEKTGIKRSVKLLSSLKINSPITFGIIKPVIILPLTLTTQLPAEQIEAILLHELAHIYRYDYWVNIFQCLIEILFFFNPFVYYLSKNIRKERENCCDDFVVKFTTKPLAYAKALAVLEQYRLRSHSPALAAANNQFQLLNRIKRIMETNHSKAQESQKSLATVLLFLVFSATFWFTYQKIYAKPMTIDTGNEKALMPENESVGNDFPPDTLNADSLVVDKKSKMMKAYKDGAVVKEWDMKGKESMPFVINDENGNVTVKTQEADNDEINDDYLADEDVEKSEAEMKRTEAEMKRAEVEIKRAEAEIKRAAASMKAAKGDEAKQKEAEKAMELAEKQLDGAVEEMLESIDAMEEIEAPMPPAPPAPPSNMIAPPRPPRPPKAPRPPKFPHAPKAEEREKEWGNRSFHFDFPTAKDSVWVWVNKDGKNVKMHIPNLEWQQYTDGNGYNYSFDWNNFNQQMSSLQDKQAQIWKRESKKLADIQRKLQSKREYLGKKHYNFSYSDAQHQGGDLEKIEGILVAEGLIKEGQSYSFEMTNKSAKLNGKMLSSKVLNQLKSALSVKSSEKISVSIQKDKNNTNVSIDRDGD